MDKFLPGPLTQFAVGAPLDGARCGGMRRPGVDERRPYIFNHA